MFTVLSNDLTLGFPFHLRPIVKQLFRGTNRTDRLGGAKLLESSSEFHAFMINSPLSDLSPSIEPTQKFIFQKFEFFYFLNSCSAARP